MHFNFINNFSQVLVGDLAIDGNNMALDAGHVLFGSASETERFPLTLFDDEGNMEIVHVFSLFNDLLYLKRAQEGTTARAWPAGTKAEARMTAEQASSFVQSVPSATAVYGRSSVSIQPARDDDTEVAAGDESIAIGARSKATDANSTAIGYSAVAEGRDITALGYLANVTVRNGTAVGAQAKVEDVAGANGSGVAMGRYSHVKAENGQAFGAYAYVGDAGEGALSVGWGASTEAEYTTLLGYASEADVNSPYSVGVGSSAYLSGAPYSLSIGTGSSVFGPAQVALGANSYPASVPGAMNLTAVPMVPKSVYTPIDAVQPEVCMRVGLPSLLRSDDADLATTGDKGAITVPANPDGMLFFIEAIDMIVMTSAEGGATPTIDIGTTASGTDILAAHVVGTDTPGARERVLDTPHGLGVNEIYFSVSAAAASAVEVRFVVHGYAMES